MGNKPGSLDRERWAVFKQYMVIMGVNEADFCKLYDEAFLNGEITIEQVKEEITANVGNVLVEKYNRIEHQEISLDKRQQVWERAKEVCFKRLEKPAEKGRKLGIIIANNENAIKYSLEVIKPEHLSLVHDFVAGKITTYDNLFKTWREGSNE